MIDEKPEGVFDKETKGQSSEQYGQPQQPTVVGESDLNLNSEHASEELKGQGGDDWSSQNQEQHQDNTQNGRKIVVEDLNAPSAVEPSLVVQSDLEQADLDKTDLEQTDVDPSAVDGASGGFTDWEAEAKHFQDLYLRALAEQENAKRRFQKDKEENARYASERVIRDLVPVLDNLNLALSYADLSQPAVKVLAEGVSMTLKGCLDMLADWGLKEVLVERGQPFDPNFHEAIGQDLDPELQDNAVIKQVSKGYTLHNRLLRPAKVIVAKHQSVS
ncbi:MAG: nucleotide exchange factor GrpE [Deltaproteobacteria bacterium]|jgi:molecular chaperone GrpE|nr:nucleotide exchange factor GrpE [Deltaproteobacteria bacterium]